MIDDDEQAITDMEARFPSPNGNGSSLHGRDQLEAASHLLDAGDTLLHKACFPRRNYITSIRSAYRRDPFRGAFGKSAATKSVENLPFWG